jgi:hypothetical protein
MYFGKNNCPPASDVPLQHRRFVNEVDTLCDRVRQRLDAVKRGATRPGIDERNLALAQVARAEILLQELKKFLAE